MKKKPTVQTAELFVGAYLGGVRTQAGIPLEQAAKDTRIRAQQLREIETDDFSGFVHPTYVRLFLLDYASYLGVPLEEIRPMLPDRADIATGGCEYLNVLGTKDNRKPKIESIRPRNRLLMLVVVMTAIIIALIVAFSFYILWRNMERVVLSDPIGKAEIGHASPAPTSIPTQKLTEPLPAVSPEIVATAEENAMSSITTATHPSVVDPSPTPAAAKPWPDVALSPFESASPTPSPAGAQSPSPTPKPPRKRSR